MRHCNVHRANIHQYRRERERASSLGEIRKRIKKTKREFAAGLGQRRGVTKWVHRCEHFLKTTHRAAEPEFEKKTCAKLRSQRTRSALLVAACRRSLLAVTRSECLDSQGARLGAATSTYVRHALVTGALKSTCANTMPIPSSCFPACNIMYTQNFLLMRVVPNKHPSASAAAQ